MLRLFLALFIPENVKAELFRHREQFRHLSGRWTSPANLHLTVLFIGRFPEAKISLLSERLSAVARATPAFNLKLKSISFAPPGRRPRMLWADFEPCPEFSALGLAAASVLPDLVALESKKESIPHATLVRFDVLRSAPRQRVFPARPLSWTTDCLHLVSSDLRPTGPVYTVRQSFPFSTPA